MPLIEASPFGAVHPNEQGQHAYANAVVQAVPESGSLACGLAALLTVNAFARRWRNQTA